jgi:heme A synthase
MAVRFAGTLWIFLVLTQFSLGAWTIWSNKAADVATAHVFFGALTLMTGVLLSVILSASVESSMRRQAAAASQKEVAKA